MTSKYRGSLHRIDQNLTSFIILMQKNRRVGTFFADVVRIFVKNF